MFLRHLLPPPTHQGMFWPERKLRVYRRKQSCYNLGQQKSNGGSPLPACVILEKFLNLPEPPFLTQKGERLRECLSEAVYEDSGS